MHPETIRLSAHAKNQLIRLKAKTGIKTWNVLCRWALATSLADPSPPLIRDIVADSNVEMSWKTFGGQHADIYLALLKVRCVADGKPVAAESVAYTLLVHLHRGIGYLSGGGVRSITDLIGTALAAAPDRDDESEEVA